MIITYCTSKSCVSNWPLWFLWFLLCMEFSMLHITWSTVSLICHPFPVTTAKRYFRNGKWKFAKGNEKSQRERKIRKWKWKVAMGNEKSQREMKNQNGKWKIKTVTDSVTVNFTVKKRTKRERAGRRLLKNRNEAFQLFFPPKYPFPAGSRREGWKPSLLRDTNSLLIFIFYYFHTHGSYGAGLFYSIVLYKKIE